MTDAQPGAPPPISSASDMRAAHRATVRAVALVCALTLAAHAWLHIRGATAFADGSLWSVVWATISAYMVVRCVFWALLRLTDLALGTSYGRHTRGWSLSLLEIETPMFAASIAPPSLRF
jgi:hypothetical protein